MIQTMAGTSDFQIFKDFIDTMVGILFLLFLLKMIFVLIKYILQPFVFGFLWVQKGIINIKEYIREKGEKFIEDYEKENAVEVNETYVHNTNSIKNSETIEMESHDSNVIDFKKHKHIRKKNSI